jgi:HEAT repeat protein/ActR/RegA family two-component response regulator
MSRKDVATQKKKPRKSGNVSKHKESFGSILKSLNSKSYEIRINAIKALGQLADGRAANKLVNLLDRKNTPEHTAAAAALLNIGKRSVMPLVKELKLGNSAGHELIIEILGQLGDRRAVKPLLAALEGSPKNRVKIVQALGLLGDDRAVKPLIGTLKVADSSARQSAVIALGQLVNVEAMKPLIGVLTDKESRIRKCAALALDDLGWQPEDDVTFASYLVAKQDWERCLELGVVSVDPLIRVLNDTDVTVCTSAAITLAELKDKRATGPLVNMINSPNSRIAGVALSALGELGENTDEEMLLRGLESLGIEAQCAVMSTLVKLGNPRALSALIAKTTSKAVRVRVLAVRLLGQMDDSLGIIPVFLLLTDPTWIVRNAAAKALDELDWRPSTVEERAVYSSAKQSIPKTIVLGEDERDIRDLSAFTLRRAGYEVFAAGDGEEAVEMALKFQPDLVLLDVRMPRMTGYEACRELKSRVETNHIPVVFLSAKGQEREIQQGLDAGAEDYLLKPYAPDQLINRIKAVFRKVYHHD